MNDRSLRACDATNAPTRATRTSSAWLCALLALSMSVGGCSSMVTYVPRATGPSQTLKYTQGVGTLAVRDVDQEVFIYPTFRTQGTTQPTFTIGYANNGPEELNFSPENVKAYFRGAEVPVYTYVERVAEIQSEKQGKQIALAILGGLAAGAAAYGASRQTYTANSSGFIRTRAGVSSFSSTSTMRVYDPASGILAGAAVGGATALGIRQLEYNAQNQEQSAASILQANTVAPLHMVSGDLVVKGCCDPFAKADDVVRFEVSARSKVYVFEFARQKVAQ